jgi:hypothetical protein
MHTVQPVYPDAIHAESVRHVTLWPSFSKDVLNPGLALCKKMQSDVHWQLPWIVK